MDQTECHHEKLASQSPKNLRRHQRSLCLAGHIDIDHTGARAEESVPKTSPAIWTTDGIIDARTGGMGREPPYLNPPSPAQHGRTEKKVRTSAFEYILWMSLEVMSSHPKCLLRIGSSQNLKPIRELAQPDFALLIVTVTVIDACDTRNHVAQHHFTDLTGTSH